MPNRRGMTLAILIVVASMVLAACGPTPETLVVKETSVVVETKVLQETVIVEKEGETVVEEVTRVVERVVTATPEPPPAGGTIVIGEVGTPAQQDPLRYQRRNFSWVNDWVYERLVELDPETGEPVPNLAKSWDISADGLTYTFYLRDDVRWHDGEPFTAEDVEFALLRILHPESIAPRGNYILIEGAEAFSTGESEVLPGVTVLDDYTIEIKLTEPFPAFLAISAGGLKPIPKHVVEGQPFADAPHYTEMMGTGPWKLVEWVIGDHHTFTANEDYWGGRPVLDGFTYLLIPDINAIINGLEAGDIQATFQVPPTEFQRLREDPDIELVLAPPFNIEGIVFNTTHPVLSDVRVRQAIAHAFDRDTFTQEFLEGATEPAAGPVLPNTWAYDPSIQPPEYDPQKARDLLAEAGYGDGLTLKISTNLGNPFREIEANVLQAQLAEIGITAEIEMSEWSVFLPSVLQGQHEIALLGASGDGGYPDPDMLYEGFHCDSGTNFAHYCNPELDELLEQGRSTMDPEERKVIYSQVQAILMEEVPQVFNFYRPIPLAYISRIEGPVLAPGNVFWNLHKWILNPE